MWVGDDPLCFTHWEQEESYLEKPLAARREEALRIREIPWFRDRWWDTDLGPADLDHATDTLMGSRLTEKFAWRVWGVRLALFSSVAHSDIAGRVGVCRQLIPRWVKRYKERGLGSLLHPNVIT